MTKVSAAIRKHEAVDSVFEVTGFSFLGAGESVGIFFIDSRTGMIARRPLRSSQAGPS